MELILPKVNYPKRSSEEIEKNWIVRHKNLVTPSNEEVKLFSLIGDTSGENPEEEGIIKEAHKFQLVKQCLTKNAKTAFIQKKFVNILFAMSGNWRIYWGNNQEQIEGTIDLGKWDVLSIPEGLWYQYENLDDETAWMFEMRDTN